MSDPLDIIELFLIDVDGVILKGKTPLKHAAEAIKALKEQGAQIFFVTNNSTKNRRTLLEQLRSANINARLKDTLTMSYCAARYLSTTGIQSVYVVGEKCLVQDIKKAGLEVVGEEVERCDAVVVGLDRNFTYRKLAVAYNFILKGARFIATNADATLPTDKGEIPGAGAIVSSIRACVKKPPLILGKPNTLLLKSIFEETGKKRCAVVGDRPETDIAMARKGGCLGILVLTGIATATRVEDYPIQNRPDLIYPSIWELASDYRAAKTNRTS